MNKPALAESYREFARKLEAGRGYYEGHVIVNDSKKCAKKKKEVLALAAHYS